MTVAARPAQIRTEAETALAGFLAARPEVQNGPAGDAQRKAAGVFALKGLPHRRVEAWHYTDLRSLMREAWPLAAASASAKAPAREGLRVMIIDGVCAVLPASSPPGIKFTALRDAMASGGGTFAAQLFPDIGADDSPAALNAALARDGVVIEIAAGVKADAPIEIHFTTSAGAPRSEYPRCLVIAGAGSSLTLSETHASAARVQRNSALVCWLSEGAQVEHVFHTGDAAPEQHIATLLGDVGADAGFQSFALVAGGSLLRRQCFIRQSGEHAKIGLRGVSLLKGKQHADTTLVIDHAVPRGESRELFKHIITGSASGVFQGKVLVRPHAQKTDGGMKSQTLLLSGEAAMSNKPELEIFADDVVCGHGATVGQLDGDQLFYLMTRGLPKAQAEGLLIEAFAREAIEFVGNGDLRESCAAALTRWLETLN